MRPEEQALLAALAAGSLDPERPRQWLFDHLEGRQPFAGYAGRLARLFALDPGTCRRLLAEVGRTDGWQPYAPGLLVRPVAVGSPLAQPGVEAAFALFSAGSCSVRHTHGGAETTLVLEGGFVDELTGRHVGPGDTLWLPAGSNHTLLIDPGEPCLAAVLLLGPLGP